MAMDDEMRLADPHKIASEAQQRRDVHALRQLHLRPRYGDDMKTQIEPLVLAEGAEGVGVGKAGIENRQDVRDARGAMAGKLGNAADGDAKGDELAGAGHGGFPLMWCGA